MSSIVSMTGFGRSVRESGGCRLEVTIKSVNSRFLDLVVKLPSQYADLEGEVQKLAKEYVKRGRVEISVFRTLIGKTSTELILNHSAFLGFIEKYREAERLGNIRDATFITQAALQILSKREVLDYAEAPRQAQDEPMLDVVLEALQDLQKMRNTEGAALARQFEEILRKLESIKQSIAADSERQSELIRERLRGKISKLQLEPAIDESRLAQEVAYLAERSDIAEELTRLDSHFVQFHKILTHGEGGKKAEFLLQEFGREFNTIGSKSASSDLSQSVVDAKAELEKLREQIQNVE
jgi:uncharacterized protein (TIGR00255 family)